MSYKSVREEVYLPTYLVTAYILVLSNYSMRVVVRGMLRIIPYAKDMEPQAGGPGPSGIQRASHNRRILNNCTR